jgi:hypothetical protein
MSQVYPNPESSHDLEIGVGDRAMPLRKAGPAALLVGLVCAVLSLILMFMPDTREAVAGAYLYGWYAIMTIVMGMLALLCLHHTVRGSWALPWLKLLQAGSSPAALGVMFVLFLPILLQPGVVYEWVNPGNDHALLKKLWYLNQTGWTIRTIFYFVLWAWMSWFMSDSVRRQEALVDDGSPESIARGWKIEMGRSSWGAAFIVVFILSVTFATTDWAMSLQPRWFSTMYPLWQLIAACLGAGGLVTAILCVNAKKLPYTEAVGPNVTKDWGNILFMFTMLWAYTAVSQYLIIWNGNLPETASYFARRGILGWNAIGMVVILGQWLMPWMTLLSPRIKRYPHLLRGVGGWIFIIHLVDVYYSIVPALPNGGFHAGRGLSAISVNIGYDLLALAAVGGIWFFVFASGVQGVKYLLPNYDRRLQEALHAH